MRSDWREATLGEISQNISRPFDFDECDDVVFINTGDVLEGKFLHSNRVSKIGLPGQAKKRIKKGDILFSEIRPANKRYALVDFDPINYVVSTKFMVIKQLSNDVDSRFFYLLLTNYMSLNEFQRIAESRSGTFPQITFDAISYFPVKLPPFPEQKAIARVIGALDDKIELNRQMNETLESMAQALFKSWFVDFDPVIDNALAAGNPIPDALKPKAAQRAEQLKAAAQRGEAPSAHRELFPAEFTYTEELGWIPKGWKVTQIGEIAKVTKGKSYKSSELSESKTALVTLKSFKRGGGYRLDGLKEYTGAYKQEQEVRVGDLVIAYTDVTQAADVIGKPAMVIDDARYDHLVISLDVAVVRPKIDAHKYFLYNLAHTSNFQNHTRSYSTGTTVLHLSKNAVPDYTFCLPEEGTLSSYIGIVEPLFSSINKNIGQMRNLEKLRDTLLPKLLSGELRVAEAAALVEGV